MNIVKFEKPGTKETKEAIANEMAKMAESNAFIVIYYNNDGDVNYSDFNMTPHDVVVALEMVKFKVITDHLA